MSLFIETIKINNGRRENLAGHSYRMNKCRNAHFHEIREIDLADIIKVPEKHQDGIVKCRVTYGRSIEKVEFEPYVFRNPRSFILVNGDDVDYGYKYVDRSSLKRLFDSKGGADDIIIVKDGLITDTYYANILLQKEDKWFTPRSPLLHGTFRAKLLYDYQVQEADISNSDIYNYDALRIINAMTELTMHPDVRITRESIISE